MGRAPLDRAPKNAKKKWTAAEENYLTEKWGTTSLKSLCRYLGRSENAVIVRVQRLGLGPGLQNGVRISWNVFQKALTGNKNGGGYLKKRLEAAGFPLHTQIIRGHNGARFTTVDIEEFWKFAEKNKDLFDFSGLEPFVFGPEPEWATLKRKLDTERRRAGHAHNDPWTEADDRRLARLLKEYKYTYTDLAQILRRSEGAIKRRIITIGIRERPIKNENRPWTKAEEQRLIEMRAQGYGFDNIAAELNRTALCVRGKYERLLNPEYMKRTYREARTQEKHERTKTCSHYIRLRGCEYGRETCKYCRKYEELQEGQKQRSDYIGIREIRPEEMSDYIEAAELRRGAEFVEVQSTASPLRGGVLRKYKTFQRRKTHMKTNVTLQTNTGFRVDRKDMEGETVVAMAFTEKNTVTTEATVAAVGNLNGRFVANFAVASVSVLKKAIEDHPEDGPDYMRLFVKIVNEEAKKLAEKNVEKRGQEVKKAREALRQTLKESGLSDEDAAEIIGSIQEFAEEMAASRMR